MGDYITYWIDNEHIEPIKYNNKYWICLDMLNFFYDSKILFFGV